MDEDKKEKLEKKGWKVGSASDFLGKPTKEEEDVYIPPESPLTYYGDKHLRKR